MDPWESPSSPCSRTHHRSSPVKISCLLAGKLAEFCKFFGGTKLNCLSCRDHYQSLHSLNALPSCNEKLPSENKGQFSIDFQSSSFMQSFFWPSTTLVSPYPLNLGGDISPPKFRGRPSPKHCKTRDFGHSTPKFRGESATPKIYPHLNGSLCPPKHEEAAPVE